MCAATWANPIPAAKGDGKGQPPLPLLRNGAVVKRVLPDDQQSLVEIFTTDNGEATNVAAANPEIVAKLQALITANESDPGSEGIAPGCREPGRVENPKPLIPHDTQ